MDITSFILGYKKGAASGGGGATVDPVHTVTFMSWDGSAVIGQRSVVDGDDCADMVARGKWEKPTKESTAQYNFTYSGWSATSGGAASASALSAVTEDRVVYAAFTSAVRYYTITFLDDDDSLFTTQSVKYGDTPVYEPLKEGYSLNGWVNTVTGEPLGAVTGDATYRAVWTSVITFATATWAEIAAVSENGEARNYFAVGDTKDVPITYSNGTTGTLKVAIAGFDHDDLADGSGKAGMSIVCMNVPNLSTLWSTKNNAITYASSDINDSLKLKKYLQNTVMPILPSSLRTCIKPVKKVTENTATGTSFKETTETLWPLSLTELGHEGTGTNSNGYTFSTPVSGVKYELFKTVNYFEGSGLNETVKNEQTKAYDDYWTRSLVLSSGSGGQTTSVAYLKPTDSYGNKTIIGTANTTTSQSFTSAPRFGFCI